MDSREQGNVFFIQWKAYNFLNNSAASEFPRRILLYGITDITSERK